MDRTLSTWHDLAMAFDHALQQGQDLEATALLEDGIARLAMPTSADADWYRRALAAPEQAGFAWAVLRGRLAKFPPRPWAEQDLQLGPAWLPILVRATVYEVNPSFNRDWLHYALRGFSARTVHEALLSYLEHGSNFEKAGAANACYWMAGATEVAGDDRSDQWIRQRQLMLQAFVTSGDVYVQCSTVDAVAPHDQDDRSPALRPLLQQARALAEAHPDPYIRSRVLGWQGKSRHLSPLPHRPPPTRSPLAAIRQWLRRLGN
jgi:hypothetical protein